MDDSTVVITLAEQLAARTTWVWRPTGAAYTPDEVGIFYGPIGETIDQGVGLTLYNTTDDIPTGLAERRIQLHYRGDPGNPKGADDLAQVAFGVLHGLSRVAGLNLVRRTLVAPLGTDGNGRQERADSYLITIDNLEA